jgi:hypothetical protein
MRLPTRQVSLSGSSDEIDHGVTQLALFAGPVLPVGGVHVDGDDPGPAAPGGHGPAIRVSTDPTISAITSVP